MIGVLIKEVYKYQDVTLDSGYKVTASEVTIKGGEIYEIPDGTITTPTGDGFSFSIYTYGNGRKVYSLNAAPEDVDGQAIIKEFVDLVKVDIAKY